MRRLTNHIWRTQRDIQSTWMALRMRDWYNYKRLIKFGLQQLVNPLNRRPCMAAWKLRASLSIFDSIAFQSFKYIYKSSKGFWGLLNVSWGRKTGVDLSLPPFFSMYIKCGIFEHTKKGGSWRSSQLWWRHKNLSSEIWGIPKIYSLLPPFSPPSSHMLSVQTNRNKGAIWENQLQLLSPHTILMFTNAKKGGRVR